MDTDVVSGLEAGLYTVLVLSGVSAVEDACRPSRIVHPVAELVDRP